jgi:segregation and condensation protein B
MSDDQDRGDEATAEASASAGVESPLEDQFQRDAQSGETAEGEAQAAPLMATDTEAVDSSESSESEEPLQEDEEEGQREQVELAPLVEALLFVSGEPLGLERLMEITRADEVAIKEALTALDMKYTGGSNGFELLKVADKYQFRTRAIFAPYIRELKAERPRRLSAAALETLAVVAYRQPVVKSDIERIRGVDVTPTLKTLLERALVKIVGHQPTAGQPALYGTTEEFLRLFSLNSLAQLPSLRDLREFERDPGESEEQSAPEPQSPQQESVAASPE